MTKVAEGTEGFGTVARGCLHWVLQIVVAVACSLTGPSAAKPSVPSGSQSHRSLSAAITGPSDLGASSAGRRERWLVVRELGTAA